MSTRFPLRPLLIVAAALALPASGCSDQHNTPPNVRPEGTEKKTDTKVLETGAAGLQDRAPLAELNVYLDGFHTMKDQPGMQMEAHHYCREANEEFVQCVIFDGNTKTANMIGLEYIISERLFDSLDAEEQKLWHPHNYEILSGELVGPGLPDVAEKAFLRKKMNSYGKTWHVWDTGHAGHPAAHSLPVGKPLLAWSFNRDGEIAPGLMEERDRRMKISTADKRKERADLAPLAHPQAGVDALKDAFPNSDGRPDGVRAK